MTSDQILAEIREANLSYLMLAQSLIRIDRDQALFRLGVSEDTATIIGTLSPAQMIAQVENGIYMFGRGSYSGSTRFRSPFGLRSRAGSTP